MGRRRKSKNKGPRGARRGGRQRALGGSSSMIPPPYVPTMRLSHKFRFESGIYNGVFAISRKNLLNLVQLATSTTTTVRIFEAVKLKSVEVWTSPPALGTAPANVSVEWLGENSPSTVVSDTSMGVRPAHVRTKPPPSSSNRWWCISGSMETDTLFQLSVGPNSVIDVTLDLRLVESEPPTAGDAPTAAVNGTLYGNCLDGILGQLIPADYNKLP